MTGIVFNIQRFSIYDGPGIRTNVFLKGCPLRCQWCHNPEGFSPRPQLSFNQDKCLLCGACEAQCILNCHSFDHNSHLLNRDCCTACGSCAAVCPSGALELIGTRMTAEEVMEQVMKDQDYYRNSGGGLTLSGGEPMFQPEFAQELAALAKLQGLSVCMETSLFCGQDKLRSIAPLIDIFLADYKETSETLHREFTGVSNRQILANFDLLNQLNRPVILRCPIIPGKNDRPEHFSGIGRMAEQFHNITRVDLEPYHPLGLSKSRNMGIPCTYKNEEAAAQNLVSQWAEAVRQHTKKEIHCPSDFTS